MREKGRKGKYEKGEEARGKERKKKKKKVRILKQSDLSLSAQFVRTR